MAQLVCQENLDQLVSQAERATLDPLEKMDYPVKMEKMVRQDCQDPLELLAKLDLLEKREGLVNQVPPVLKESQDLQELLAELVLRVFLEYPEALDQVVCVVPKEHEVTRVPKAILVFPAKLAILVLVVFLDHPAL